MFTGGMKESREKVITIPETTFPAFVALIQYLYTGQLDVDVNLALDVLPLSSQYNLERLMVGGDTNFDIFFLHSVNL
jgi:hypothetical protein